MAKDRSLLATAILSSTAWVVSRKCVAISLGVAVVGAALLWGLYSPPVPAVTRYNATVAEVETWAAAAAPCKSGGSARNVYPYLGAYAYDCQDKQLGRAGFFTILILLATFVLMVAGYPPDLTMLAATITFVTTGVLDPAEGELCGRALPHARPHPAFGSVLAHPPPTPPPPRVRTPLRTSLTSGCDVCLETQTNRPPQATLASPAPPSCPSPPCSSL